MNDIRGFFGEHRFLSNFWPVQISLLGIPSDHWVDPDEAARLQDIVFPSVEHAYQAAKTDIILDRLAVQRLPTPGQAKKYGKTVRLRPSWSTTKVAIMTSLIARKFNHDHNPELVEMLLSTGDRYLEETNGWGDTYWGVCEGVGANHLGRILMHQRSALRVYY